MRACQVCGWHESYVGTKFGKFGDDVPEVLPASPSQQTPLLVSTYLPGVWVSSEYPEIQTSCQLHDTSIPENLNY